jgi:hypothetical protein
MFSSIVDREPTGNFEVTFIPTGELIHSRTKKGHGVCSTEKEIIAIIGYIHAYKDSIPLEKEEEGTLQN